MKYNSIFKANRFFLLSARALTHQINSHGLCWMKLCARQWLSAMQLRADKLINNIYARKLRRSKKCASIIDAINKMRWLMEMRILIERIIYLIIWFKKTYLFQCILLLMWSILGWPGYAEAEGCIKYLIQCLRFFHWIWCHCLNSNIFSALQIFHQEWTLIGMCSAKYIANHNRVNALKMNFSELLSITSLPSSNFNNNNKPQLKIS